jgi:hypothetical protein
MSTKEILKSYNKTIHLVIMFVQMVEYYQWFFGVLHFVFLYYVSQDVFMFVVAVAFTQQPNMLLSLIIHDKFKEFKMTQLSMFTFL